MPTLPHKSLIRSLRRRLTKGESIQSNDSFASQDSGQDHLLRNMNADQPHQPHQPPTSSLTAAERAERLRQYSFFLLEVHLRFATNLTPMDSCGTSDPYVKFFIGDKVMYRSKTVKKSLDPKWDENFTLPIEDIFTPLVIRGFDYDFGFSDDFLGEAAVSLTQLDFNR